MTQEIKQNLENLLEHVQAATRQIQREAEPPQPPIKSAEPAPTPSPVDGLKPRLQPHDYFVSCLGYAFAWSLLGLILAGFNSVEFLVFFSRAIYYLVMFPGSVSATALLLTIFYKYIRPNPTKLEVLQQVIIAYPVGLTVLIVIGFRL